MDTIKQCYSDLKVSARGSRLTDLLQTAVKLGYRRVAVDVEIVVTNKKTVIPSVKDLEELMTAVTIPKELELLKRITLSLDDPNLLHTTQATPVLEGYDITALKTTSEKVFQSAVSCISTDIITLEWEDRLGFPIRPTQVSQILAKGVYFEVMYTPAIKDSTHRRHTISNMIQLAAASKGKGIIVSSGAEKGIELRGPLDIINLCHLFGMKTEHCKATVTGNCAQVISHSRQRKDVVKGAVSCYYCPSSEKKQGLKRPRDIGIEESDIVKKNNYNDDDQ